MQPNSGHDCSAHMAPTSQVYICLPCLGLLATPNSRGTQELHGAEIGTSYSPQAGLTHLCQELSARLGQPVRKHPVHFPSPSILSPVLPYPSSPSSSLILFLFLAPPFPSIHPACYPLSSPPPTSLPPSLLPFAICVLWGWVGTASQPLTLLLAPSRAVTFGICFEDKNNNGYIHWVLAPSRHCPGCPHWAHGQ